MKWKKKHHASAGRQPACQLNLSQGARSVPAEQSNDEYIEAWIDRNSARGLAVHIPPTLPTNYRWTAFAATRQNAIRAIRLSMAELSDTVLSCVIFCPPLPASL